jgi:hypothetical protein
MDLLPAVRAGRRLRVIRAELDRVIESGYSGFRRTAEGGLADAAACSRARTSWRSDELPVVPPAPRAKGDRDWHCVVSVGPTRAVPMFSAEMMLSWTSE